jgi:predicted RNase H-like HicB family nuclease
MDRGIMDLSPEQLRKIFPGQLDGPVVQVIVINQPVDNSTHIHVEGGITTMPSEAAEKKHTGMITLFLNAAMKQAKVELLEDEGKFYGEIPACPGVWAVGKTESECLDDLRSVLEEWTLFKLRDGDKDFPLLDNMNLNLEWQVDRAWGC